MSAEDRSWDIAIYTVWHIVQQAQGRVQPTTQLKNVVVNDDPG
ncbi:MAG TPA: hypothetical protein VF941_13680 [Clostridia bacterium]